MYPHQATQPGDRGWPKPRNPVQVGYPTERPVPLTICDDGTGLCRPDSGQPLELDGGGRVEVENGARGSPLERRTRRREPRSPRYPAEGEVGSDGREQSLSDARHPVEALGSAERPSRLAIGNDGLGKCEAYSWKASQLQGRSPVGVDALSGTQRALESENAVAMRGGGTGGKGGEQLDLTRGLTGPGGEPPHPLAGQSQRQQEQQRTPLGGRHERRVQQMEGTVGRRITRTGAGQCGLLFFSHQSHRDITHDLEARGGDLVDRVEGGVPGRIVEVHDVDGTEANFLQLQMVVDQSVLG